jgi:branched-chain amino acid transport system ATP-binding protein
MVPAVLETRNLQRSYGGVAAVDGVSLRIDTGAIYGVIGPNGAGKSSLFKLLSGFVSPNGGEIWFDGRRIDHCPAHERARLGIARTFQELEVFPALSAGDILTTATLLRHSLGEARRRARAIAADLEIPWGALPAELGPGMLRRLELGRCLALEPRLVLFDEVMAGLTMAEAQFMMRRIEALHASGVAVVIVEHVMHVVRALCRHLYVMASGRLIAEGTPEQVSADPTVVAAYLGTRAARLA